MRAAHSQALDSDRVLHAEQNARLVVNAERCNRAALGAGADSWNLRDRHSSESLEAHAAHWERTRSVQSRLGPQLPRLGDARATELGRSGELNLGQLVRERHPGRTGWPEATTHPGR